MIEKLELKNFTKFANLSGDQAINFSSKINIIIGENGTGKTQLLKAAYAACFARSLNTPELPIAEKFVTNIVISKLLSSLLPTANRLGALVKNDNVTGDPASLFAGFYLGGNIAFEFKATSKISPSNAHTHPVESLGLPLFFPTKEVMSLLRGISAPESDEATLQRLFDSTYFDLCKKLMIEPKTNELHNLEKDPRFGEVYQKLTKAMGGEFSIEDGVTIFRPGQYKERRAKNQNKLGDKIETIFVPLTGASVSANMSAEGIRKLGIVQRLLVNRQLNPGVSGPLFWDEPETNMNPKLMRLLVEILLTLSRNGQQVIIATHDYVLLKWFDLLMDKGKGDHVKYHALYRSEDQSDIKVESEETYHLLDKNAISNAFTDLYDAEIDRSLGAKK